MPDLFAIRKVAGILKIERLVAMLSVLASAERITVKDLADRFEVSKRTVFRDLETLSRSGVPIVSYPGIGGGVGVLAGYKVNKSILSAEEAGQICTGLQALKSIQADDAITNLIAKLVPGAQADVGSQSEYVIDLSSWFLDSRTAEKIAALRQAISGSHCLRLDYISMHSRMERIVEPHRLLFKQSHWYLYAFCRERREFRLFKLRRIASYEIMEETFAFKAIEPIKVGKSYGNDVFFPEQQEKKFAVILEYDLADEFFLTDRVDASLCKRVLRGETAAGEIRFAAADLKWVAEFVFSILDKVRVISPPELKSEIRQRLNKINKFYKDDI